MVYGAGEQGDVRPLADLPSRLPLPSSSLHPHLYFPYFLKVLALASDTYIGLISNRPTESRMVHQTDTPEEAFL
jgi:hypothetical protein